MTSEVETTDNSEGTGSMVSSAAIFVGGAAVGAIAALFLAPQAGRESRQQLSEYGRRTGETISEWANAAYGLFATEEKVKGSSAQEQSEKRTVREETVIKPRPHAVAH